MRLTGKLQCLQRTLEEREEGMNLLLRGGVKKGISRGFKSAANPLLHSQLAFAEPARCSVESGLIIRGSLLRVIAEVLTSLRLQCIQGLATQQDRLVAL